MRSVPFKVDNNSIYKHYQTGRGNVFSGELIQKGYGLSNIISGLTKFAVPVIKSHILPLVRKGARYAGKAALKSGQEIISDTLINKKPLKKTVKRVANKQLEELIKTVHAKKRKQKGGRTVNKQKYYNTEHDIFS